MWLEVLPTQQSELILTMPELNHSPAEKQITPQEQDFVRKPFKLNLEYDVWRHWELTPREKSEGN
jgi:hypothetical protein